MNDRNAFLQGQGSPIKDDAPPPEQGWRGERSADEAPAGDRRQRTIEGTDIRVEEVSGVGYAEATGEGDAAPPEGDAQPDPTLHTSSPKRSGDGVNDLADDSESPGGESGGAPYPNPHHGKEGGSFGTFMGHGGQSDIAYHGSGHLGEKDVDDGDNRNGVAEND